ncbi:MAG: class I adenylate-forming enzyme family protein [Gammaproteobacteria bacterium]
MNWPGNFPETRLEAHFGDRVVRCWRDRPADVNALLAHAAGRGGTGDALVAGDLRLTWAALEDRVGRLAAGLAARGITAGERVALLLRNGPEFVPLFFAVLRLGAIAVPLNVREREPELRHVLADCGARAIVHHADLADRLPAPAHVPALRLRVSAGGDAPGAEPYAALAASAAIPAAAVAEEDTAAIVYTSGTTGRPKGAMITHLGLVHAGMTYARVMDLTAADRGVAAVPLSHVTGLTGGILAMCAAGGTLVVMEEFKAPEFLELAARERMSVTVLVPAMYKLCLLQKQFDPARLRNWRLGVYGGAIMPAALIEEIAARLPWLGLMNGYGATETTSAVAMMPPRFTATRGASVGCAVPCGEIFVADDDGRELPPGEIGEVFLRAPTTVKGYWNNPEATAREFVGGFWRSGDLGRLSADGFLEILDRKKDMINRGGFKVYAAEVEGVLARDPLVAEAAVIGRPCPVLGERVHAVVVPAGPGFDPDALRALCARELSDYKVPEAFTVRSEPLPRNANGKVLKRQLRAELESGA